MDGKEGAMDPKLARDSVGGVGLTDVDIHDGGKVYIERKSILDEEADLPLANSHGNANWSNIVVHNITAMVGAGVLGLPNTLVYLGWGPGMFVHMLSFVSTLYGLWQLCAMHIMQGKRFNRYHDLAIAAWGPVWGPWILLPCQLIVMIGLDIVYCVTGGSSLRFIYGHLCSKPCTSMGLSAWIVVFTMICLILSQIPNFHKLSGLSLLAAFMSIGYCTIAIGLSGHAGKQPGTEYNLNGYSAAGGTFNVFNSLGTVAFAYGGHNVVLEIMSTLPIRPKNAHKENPVLKPMLIGVAIAYAVVFYTYFGVSISGYWAFGENTGGQIITYLGKTGLAPIWSVITAEFFIVVHVMGSFQVYALPVYDMIEAIAARRRFRMNIFTRFVYRGIYVVLCGLIAVILPFFGSLLGFIGALGFGPTTFTFPGLLWLTLKKPKRWSAHWTLSWLCAIYGIIVTVIGAIGGMWSIITTASSYSFFQ